MKNTIPEHRREALAAVIDALDGAQTAVLTTHINADGDGCGSALAFAAWLRARGTETFLVCPTPFPAMYRFLVPDPTWVVDARDGEAKELCKRADVAVVLDTGEVPRIGRVKPMIEALPKVVIDHHQPGDHPIKGTALRDAEASATGELVYDFFAHSDGPWTEVALNGMYVAILTDTGSFRFSNSTADAHRVAGDLIARGVDAEAVYRRVYGTYPLRRYRLLEHVLPTLDVSSDGRVAWMTVPREAYDGLGAIPDDLEGIVDVPRGVDGVEVGLLFRSTTGGGTKISFRANGSVNVNELARAFGGGGHVKAAGALVDGPLDKVRDDVITATVAAVHEALGAVGTPD
jgi:bifunctional oligoribonuclease and PAP phosphatase NrnA